MNAIGRNADRVRKPVLAEPRRLQKLVLEDIARMRIFQCSHLSLSVTIDDFDVLRLALGPMEADAPLIVDPKSAA